MAAKYYTYGLPKYFSAYIRPGDGDAVTTEIYSTTAFPHDSATGIVINVPSSASPNNYEIRFDNETFNQHFSTQITSTMRSNFMTIGNELSGTSSATMGEADWFGSMYGGNDGTLYYQTNGGTVGVTGRRDPPSGGWVTVPAPGNSGGRFYSTCC